MKNEKNDELVIVTFKVKKSIKERFVKVAKANDITPSQLLRDRMVRYNAENAQLALFDK